MTNRLALTVAVVVIAFTTDAFASGTGASIKVDAPTSVKIGQKFNVSVSGQIPQRQLSKNWAVEVFYQLAPCTATFASEHQHKYYPLGGAFIMHPSFHIFIKTLTAQSPGQRRFCAYIDRYTNPSLTTSATLATGSLVVTYHS